MNEIEKIKYSISYFDVDIMAVGRTDLTKRSFFDR